MTVGEFIAQTAPLMARSRVHYRWTIQDFVRLIYPPAELGQVVAARNPDGRVVGFATIGLFSPEVSAGYIDKTRKILPRDWRSGDELWLVDVVAPDGAARFITSMVRAKARDMGYKGKYIHFRRDYGGRSRVGRALI